MSVWHCIVYVALKSTLTPFVILNFFICKMGWYKSLSDRVVVRIQ
jgi:hypothetical protein